MDTLMMGARNAALNLLRNWLNGEESLDEGRSEDDDLDLTLGEAA